MKNKKCAVNISFNLTNLILLHQENNEKYLNQIFLFMVGLLIKYLFGKRYIYKEFCYNSTLSFYFFLFSTFSLFSSRTTFLPSLENDLSHILKALFPLLILHSLSSQTQSNQPAF